MSTRLRQILDRVIEKEGGFVDHPADRGGPTKYGITEAVARARGFGGRMRDLPIELAREIYRDQYVHAPGFHRILRIDEPIAEELIDTGINMGPATASRFLQRSLNGLNRGEKLYPDVPVDGICGPQTAGAFAAYVSARGSDGRRVLLRLLDSLQAVRYLEIAESRRSQEEFLFGWLRQRTGHEFSS